jgi:hypothetical protein
MVGPDDQTYQETSLLKFAFAKKIERMILFYFYSSNSFLHYLSLYAHKNGKKVDVI